MDLYRRRGQLRRTMNILPGESACLACVFPQPPAGAVETCDTGGILNSAVNLIASIAVTEAMKFSGGPSHRNAPDAVIFRRLAQ